MAKSFSAYELLKQIHAGTIDPKLLSPKDRRICIPLLMERMSKAEIAGRFGVDDRTIRRDLEQIKKENALKISPKFSEEWLGHLCHEVDRNYWALIRLAANSGTARVNPAQARTIAVDMLFRFSILLQSCGYLSGVTQSTDKPDSEEKKSSPSNSDKLDPEILKKIESLGPMERETLIKEIQKDILDLSEKLEQSDGAAEELKINPESQGKAQESPEATP